MMLNSRGPKNELCGIYVVASSRSLKVLFTFIPFAFCSLYSLSCTSKRLFKIHMFLTSLTNKSWCNEPLTDR